MSVKQTKASSKKVSSKKAKKETASKRKRRLTRRGRPAAGHAKKHGRLCEGFETMWERS